MPLAGPDVPEREIAAGLGLLGTVGVAAKPDVFAGRKRRRVGLEGERIPPADRDFARRQEPPVLPDRESIDSDGLFADVPHLGDHPKRRALAGQLDVPRHPQIAASRGSPGVPKDGPRLDRPRTLIPHFAFGQRPGQPSPPRRGVRRAAKRRLAVRPRRLLGARRSVAGRKLQAELIVGQLLGGHRAPVAEKKADCQCHDRGGFHSWCAGKRLPPRDPNRRRT